MNPKTSVTGRKAVWISGALPKNSSSCSSIRGTSGLSTWRITGHRGRRYRSSCPRIRRRMMAADQSGLPAGRYASGLRNFRHGNQHFEANRINSPPRFHRSAGKELSCGTPHTSPLRGGLSYGLPEEMGLPCRNKSLTGKFLWLLYDPSFWRMFFFRSVMA